MVKILTNIVHSSIFKEILQNMPLPYFACKKKKRFTRKATRKGLYVYRMAGFICEVQIFANFARNHKLANFN